MLQSRRKISWEPEACRACLTLSSRGTSVFVPEMCAASTKAPDCIPAFIIKTHFGLNSRNETTMTPGQHSWLLWKEYKASVQRKSYSGKSEVDILWRRAQTMSSATGRKIQDGSEPRYGALWLMVTYVVTCLLQWTAGLREVLWEDQAEYRDSYKP